MNEYLTEFERLANCIVGLPPPFLLSCFISGLSLEIRREVQALQPITLTQATTLAKLQEEKIDDRKRGYKGKTPFHSSPTNPTSTTTTSTTTTAQPLSLPSSTPPNPKVHFRNLSPDEMAARREKGLCYNCDEKWHASHKCKGRFFFIIADDDDDDAMSIPPPIESPPPEPSDDSAVQISFNALSGTPAPESLRLFGSIAKTRVTVLIDGGSTHNFIQTRLAKFLALPTLQSRALQVMVGNGTLLECAEICQNIPLTIQGHTFEVDLHILPISGADIVLGIQWLKRLGPITTDYQALTMQFHRNGQQIELRADAPSGPTDASAHEVKCYLQTHAASAFFHISITQNPPHDPNTNPPNTTPTHPIPEIASLLHQYRALFNPPSEPPPSPTKSISSLTHHQ